MKKLFKSIFFLILIVVFVAAAYVLYLQFNFYRIEDNTVLNLDNNMSDTIKTGTTYKALTYNVGFGAYSQNYSFFMDSGTMADGTKVSGKYGKGISQEDVSKNIQASIDFIKNNNADFILLQELDVKATRSYGLNQVEMVKSSMNNYGSVFANNFHSAYLFYPFNDPHGAVDSGILTLSKYNIDGAVRKSLPIDMSFITKFTDLDRCFSLSRLKVDNGKELILINAHFSAYDKGGIIRKQQLEVLNKTIEEEYAKGNYIIVGGDFNQDIANSKYTFPSKQVAPEWVMELTKNELVDGVNIVLANNSKEVPTCRAAEIPYEKGLNHTVVIDGFIVSNNIYATAKNIDNDFMYSDHNPVELNFILK
ncbi:MAG: endonuclease [Christensenellaceae bacterium]|nr:endonuclease [Christensenellaceae bacterium]